MVVVVGDLRVSFSSWSFGRFLRLILTDLKRSSVLDLEGRGRPVDGVDEDEARREVSWEVKAREPERSVGEDFFCFLGGGWPYK